MKERGNLHQKTDKEGIQCKLSEIETKVVIKFVDLDYHTKSVLWKKIPSEIRKLPSLNVFKTSFHGKEFSNKP